MAIPEFPKGSKLHMTLSNFETKAGVYNFEVSNIFVFSSTVIIKSISSLQIPSEDECKIWKDELSKLLCDQANIIKSLQSHPSIHPSIHLLTNPPIQLVAWRHSPLLGSKAWPCRHGTVLTDKRSCAGHTRQGNLSIAVSAQNHKSFSSTLSLV